MNLNTSEHDDVKDHRYFKLLDNNVMFTPSQKPFRASITVKIQDDMKLMDIVSNVLDCFATPFRVDIDWWFVISSSTRLVHII